jgi:predicted PurR-regulated permease PerM
VLAFISFVLVQQVENHYLTPRVMGRSVNLNPILVIVFIFIGFALGGVMGGLIAVPIAGVVGILLRHLVIEPRKEEAAPRIVEGGVLLPGATDLKDSKIVLPSVSE